MKKLLLTLAVLVMTVSFASAQSFGVGDKVATAQISLSGSLDIPMPITVSYEQGVCNLGDIFTIGVGGALDFGSQNDLTIMSLGAIGNVHYAIEKFDFSAGLALCYESVKYEGLDGASDFGFNINIAAKYYFSDKLGIVANFGTGFSDFSAGICYKF